MSKPIQLDAAFCYQQAVIEEVRRALRRTHGDVFTIHYLAEFRGEILHAVKTRICGRREAWLEQETERIKLREIILGEEAPFN
ncbi:hypothetical protein [Duganella fentianensis]|uniref:hypothetical protein n=1 Tax=Duganella fentianensis TaxID=2692177 RepID=UPI0032B1D952